MADDPFHLRPRSPSAVWGARLAAAILGLVALAMYLAVGPNRTRRDLAACDAAYANARTHADSLHADSMHVNTLFWQRTSVLSPPARCAEFRAVGAR